MKIFSISKLIRKMRRIRIRYLFVYHTPLTYQTSNRPLRTVCPMIFPVLLKYPDEFILNTKVVQNSSTNTDAPPICLTDVHDTSGMIPPPLYTLSGNHPELAVHPRMNSHSEQRALQCVR